MDLSLITPITGIITSIIGIFTFFKAFKEYRLQGIQKQLDLFLQMRRKFKENESFREIASMIDKNDKKLEEERYKEKRDYAGFFKKIALMINSGLITKNVGCYMFGYFAVHRQRKLLERRT